MHQKKVFLQQHQGQQRNSLPEANVIFKLLQHAKKSIYPFEMKSKINMEMTSQQEPYLYTEKKNILFQPLLPTIRQHFDKKYLIYDKFNNNLDEDLFNMNIYPMNKLTNLKNHDYLISKDITQSYHTKQHNLLAFDSRFQSGNLSMVALHNNTYYLLLHNDVNTSGYTSWFYFSVKNTKKGCYRFAIMNYGKAGWQHNQGVRICVKVQDKPWQRSGTNIHCQPNRNIFKKGSLLNFNTLYFEYEFTEDNSQVYFAYCIPYTYNDLCCFLDEIQQKKSPYFHRKLAGLSLAGNKLQLISITNFQKLKVNNMNAVIFTARSHPGETVSSWIMHYLIKFLLSDDPNAEALRNNFVFKIFPMMNPDGVIHGNYRCSLSGRDLNRRWGQPNKQLFPQVYYIKNQILEIHKKRTIKVFIDLHGHTQKKKIFAYGCNDKQEFYRCRLYPYLMSKLTDNFQFKFCNFHIDKSKIGTARVSLFNQLKIPYIYTIETSQYGTYNGHHCSTIFKEAGQSLAIAIKILFHLSIPTISTISTIKPINTAKSTTTDQKINSKYQMIQSIENNFETELLNDSNLMKIGNDKDNGSDSEPSVDNIDYDKLKKLNERKNLYLNSSIKAKSNIKYNKASIDNIANVGSSRVSDYRMNRPRTTENLVKLENRKKIEKLSFQHTVINSRKRFRPQNSSSSEIHEKLLNKSQRKNLSLRARQTETVNFINLSLSINDNIRDCRQTSCRLGFGPLSSHFNQEEIIKRLKIPNRNLYIFRRRK